MDAKGLPPENRDAALPLDSDGGFVVDFLEHARGHNRVPLDTIISSPDLIAPPKRKQAFRLDIALHPSRTGACRPMPFRLHHLLIPGEQDIGQVKRTWKRKCHSSLR